MPKSTTVTRSREFLENVIDAVREPLLVLNQDLRIVAASRAFYDVFRVIPQDTLGELIYDLGNRQWDIPQLRELLEAILLQSNTFNDYEVVHDFTSIGRRTMLLNARQASPAGGVVKVRVFNSYKLGPVLVIQVTNDGLGIPPEIMDDDEAIRDAVGHMMEGLGFDVLRTANGSQTLESHAHIVLMSGHFHAAMGVPLCDGEGLFRLAKPFDLQELSQVLASCS